MARPSHTKESFFKKTIVNGSCIEFVGGKIGGGYGRVNFNGQRFVAHRLAWELTNGPIPEGLFVLHKCDNPPCINPDHLFLGTNKDNTQDMLAKGRRQTKKLFCKRGHSMAGDNIIHYANGKRKCKACHKLVAYKSYIKRKKS